MHPFDTPRLYLRPLGEGDEALYCGLYTDPELMRHIAAPLSIEAAQRSFGTACRQQSPQKQRWIIAERGEDDGIGLLGLFADGEAAEIGVMLLANWQGRGYAAEAIAAMADRIFAAEAIRMLWTRHAPGNGLATGLMHKLGFVCEDTEHAELRWHLPREQWLARRVNRDDVAMSGGDR
ncbi:MAG TPA: GNAT family N-acetyltransferase [Luteimonas sp.]|nr:GNAT family N-acetyltransferase [Luteimonas sp.]